MLGATRNPIEHVRRRGHPRGRAGHRPPRATSTRPTSPSTSASPARRSPTRTSAASGPERTGCIDCGACMTGCRFGAKNTLDKNYLYLAERSASRSSPRPRSPRCARPGEGYRVETRAAHGPRRAHPRDEARRLRRRRARDAPAPARACRPIPQGCRGSRRGSGTACAPTTSRSSRSSASGATTISRTASPSASILHTDEHSHIEPVRYGAGLRLLPPARRAARRREPRFWTRLANLPGTVARHPLSCCARALVPDFAQVQRHPALHAHARGLAAR